MAVRDIFRISRKTFFNPAGWVDAGWQKFQAVFIWQVLRDLFTPAKPLREETFPQAMKRLGMSETDVTRATRLYRFYTFCFLLLGLTVFVYAFYLLFQHKTFPGFLLAIAASSLFFVQAFKYDFWSLQMSQRKLGLTLKDWQRHRIGG